VTTESPPRRRDPGATTPRGPSVTASQPDVPTVPVRADILEAAAQLVAEAGDQVELAERLGYSRGDRVGALEGYELGYGDGFEAGVEIGAMRTLLGVEHVVGAERLQELSSAAWDRLPHAAGYLEYRRRTAVTGELCTCPPGRTWSCCVRRDHVLARRARGLPDDLQPGELGRNGRAA
jgi:hypothetical protein